MAEKDVDQLPVDILVEIFSRLPAKSLSRLVWVSKFWASVIRGEDLRRCFSSRSQPRLLLAVSSRVKGYEEKWLFFSKSCEPVPSPPGQIARFTVEEESPDFVSSTVCQLKKLRYNMPSYVHGLISFLYGGEQVVCNPSTCKSITLPTVETTEMIVRSFLGYDPIDAQYKVLCLTNATRFCEHQVLTLGSSPTQESCSWRRIRCSTPHYALGDASVCVDGVLYFIASPYFHGNEPLLAAFDLRSETLEISPLFLEGFGSSRAASAVLINYHGKLALAHHSSTWCVWVLEDAQKREWPKQVLRLRFPEDDPRRPHASKMVGAPGLGQFVYAEHLYLYFVDHRSEQITSVVLLQGSTNHEFRQVFAFLHHVESLMFI